MVEEPKRRQGESLAEYERRVVLLDVVAAAKKEIAGLRAALNDCAEIAGSDCEHELCKAIIERAQRALKHAT